MQKMRETNCKNYSKCLNNGALASAEFDCNDCDGTVKEFKEQPALEKAAKRCRGALCIKQNSHGVLLPLSEFGKNKARTEDGRQIYCKKCINAQAKAWYEAHGRPDRIAAKKNREVTAPVPGNPAPATNPYQYILDLLEDEVEYHAAQITRIKNAMAALTGE